MWNEFSLRTAIYVFYPEYSRSIFFWNMVTTIQTKFSTVQNKRIRGLDLYSVLIPGINSYFCQFQLGNMLESDSF